MHAHPFPHPIKKLKRATALAIAALLLPLPYMTLEAGGPSRSTVGKTDQARSSSSNNHTRSAPPRATPPPRSSNQPSRAAEPSRSSSSSSNSRTSQPRVSQPRVSHPRVPHTRVSQPRTSQPRANTPRASQPQTSSSVGNRNSSSSDARSSQSSISRTSRPDSATIRSSAPARPQQRVSAPSNNSRNNSSSTVTRATTPRSQATGTSSRVSTDRRSAPSSSHINAPSKNRTTPSVADLRARQLERNKKSATTEQTNRDADNRIKQTQNRGNAVYRVGETHATRNQSQPVEQSPGRAAFYDRILSSSKPTGDRHAPDPSRSDRKIDKHDKQHHKHHHDKNKIIINRHTHNHYHRGFHRNYYCDGIWYDIPSIRVYTTYHTHVYREKRPVAVESREPTYEDYDGPYHFEENWHVYPRDYYVMGRQNSFYFFVDLGHYKNRNVPDWAYDRYLTQLKRPVDIYRTSNPLGKAYAAFAKGKYYESLANFRRAIYADPENGLIHLARAQAQIAIRDYRAAFLDISRGLELFPEWADVRVNLSEIYSDPDEDLRHAEQLEDWVDRYPRDYKARFVLGYLHYFHQDYAAAKDELLYALAWDEQLQPARLLMDRILEIEAETEILTLEHPPTPQEEIPVTSE